VKLYSGPLSLFTAKVRIALAEKRIAYERVEVGWSFEDRYLPHHPDVAELNPKREVPVLVDGDLVVYDSTLILEYLEERQPEPRLYPEEIAERARCRQLEAAADEILFPPLWDLIDAGFYPGGSGGGGDAERLARAKAELSALSDGLEKELAGREYLCRDFSVADIGTFIVLQAANTLGAPVAETRPALGRWFERVLARPSVRREVDEMNAFVRDRLVERASAG
jgi:glutathione S-transferase